MALLPELETALRNADAAGAADDARMLAREISRMRQEGKVNEPISIQSAVAARNDLYPNVKDRFSEKYNPGQSVFGYVGNEAAKAATGLLSLPDMTIRALAQNPMTPLGALANVGQRARDALGVPSISRIGQILGVEQNLKAPGPGTEFLTGAGIDVATNALFPGGTAAQKVLGGVGSFLGRKAGEAGGTTGELTGSIVGGVAMPALLASRANNIKTLFDFATRDKAELVKSLQSNPQLLEKVRNDVLNELAEDLRHNPELYLKKFSEAQAIEQALPGVKFNLAQRFTAPSMVQQQMRIDASGGPQRNQAAALRGEQEAVLNEAAGVSPTARIFAEKAIGDVTEGARTKVASLSDEIAATSKQAQEISNRIARTVDVEDLGERALAIRGNLLQEARGQANRLMDAAVVASKNENAVFDGAEIAKRASDIRSQPVWDDANYPAIFTKIKQWSNDIGDAPGGMWTYFEDVRDMRQAVNKDIANALKSNSPNARSQLHNLRELQKSIDSVIEASPYPQTKDAYKKFNEYYRYEFAPRFLRGVNLEAEKIGARGEPMMAGEKVFDKYFKPGSATNMARYLRLYGDNTEAMTAMHDAIRDRYARQVVNQSTGLIDEGKHASFLKQYERPLRTLEQQGFRFADELKDTQKSLAAVLDRKVALEDSVARINGDSAIKLLRDEFGAKTPDAVMKEVLSDPRKMKAVITRMNDSQSKGLVDFLSSELAESFKVNGNISPEKIGKFFENKEALVSYRSALAKAYGSDHADDHIETIRKIASAAERIELTQLPRPSSASERFNIFDDKMKKATGLSYAVIGNMMRAALRGQVSPEWAAIVLGGQAFGTVMQKMQNEIYKEVLQDRGTATKLFALLRSPPESKSFGSLTMDLLKHSPRLFGMFIGIQSYPRFGLQAGANLVRDQASTEQQP